MRNAKGKKLEVKIKESKDKREQDTEVVNKKRWKRAVVLTKKKLKLQVAHLRV